MWMLTISDRVILQILLFHHPLYMSYLFSPLFPYSPLNMRKKHATKPEQEINSWLSSMPPWWFLVHFMVAVLAVDVQGRHDITDNSRYTCSPFYCGHLQDVQYPFRLQGDPGGVVLRHTSLPAPIAMLQFRSTQGHTLSLRLTTSILPSGSWTPTWTWAVAALFLAGTNALIYMASSSPTAPSYLTLFSLRGLALWIVRGWSRTIVTTYRSLAWTRGILLSMCWLTIFLLGTLSLLAGTWPWLLWVVGACDTIMQVMKFW